MTASHGKIAGINGNMLTVDFDGPVIQNEVAYPVLNDIRLKAEVIRIRGAQADLQVVGGVKASGLRTRIIESMVYGVPVFSTAEMAEGLSGLADGENILLAADAQDYADRLTNLVTSPPDFDQLARSARKTYDENNGRQIAMEVLKNALQEFL